MRARWIVVPAGGVAALVFMAVAGFTAGGTTTLFALSVAGADSRACQPGTLTPAADAPRVGSLDDEQRRNAGAIIAVGQSMNVPERGWVIAIATAMQESTLHNIRHGDVAGPDSTGLFQQRDPWGPRAVREDPAGAARLFYQALGKVAGWETLPLYVAAQAVQRSGFPYLYARHEAAAQHAVAALAGVMVASPTCRAVTLASGKWALPMPAGKVRPPVGEHHPRSPGKSIPAVDLPLPAGERQPVYSITGGTASPMEEPGGCGHGVYVRVDGDAWLYCHLSEQDVTAGQQVNAGDQIGVSGWSGHVDPPGPGSAHLHVQLTHAGHFTCLQPLIDALKRGETPPAISELPQPPTNTCLPAWAALHPQP